jgi:hypothetical protein
MDYSNSIDRTAKRNRVNDAIGRAYARLGRAARTVLVFPSGTCYDVAEMLRIGFADSNTCFICVESDACRRRAMKRTLRELGVKNDKIRIIAKDLSKLPPADFSRIVDSTGCRVEFAFLDYCGELTLPIVRWIHDNVTCANFADEAALFVTNKTAFRFREFIDHKLSKIVTANATLYNELVDKGRRSSALDYFRKGYTMPRHVIFGIFVALTGWRVRMDNSEEYRNDDCVNNMLLAEFYLLEGRNSKRKNALYADLTA